MIRFIYGYNLLMEPELAISMFQTRAEQFAKRLKWSVHVDKNGMERDIYDTLNPLYIIITDDDGDHLGSMRFLPSTGKTMLNDHFRHVYGGPTIQDRSTWECTRFCLSPNATPKTALQLLAAGGRLMSGFEMSRIVAVFDEKMFRVYKKCGVSPSPIGSCIHQGDRITVGYWDYSKEQYSHLLEAAGLDGVEMELCVENSDIAQENRRHA